MCHELVTTELGIKTLLLSNVTTVMAVAVVVVVVVVVVVGLEVGNRSEGNS